MWFFFHWICVWSMFILCVFFGYFIALLSQIVIIVYFLEIVGTCAIVLFDHMCTLNTRFSLILLAIHSKITIPNEFYSKALLLLFFFRSSNQSIGRLVNGSCVYVIFQLFSGCARVHHLRNLLYGFVNNLFQLCFCSQKWRHTNEIIRYAIKSLNTTYSTLSFILMSFSQVNCSSLSK